MAHSRWIAAFAAGLPLLTSAAPASPSAPEKLIATIDLSAPFATRGPWRFTASQGPDVPEEMGPGFSLPGQIRLCISKDKGRSCDPDLGRALQFSPDDTYFEQHYLELAKVVRPRGVAGRPLLLLRLGGMPGFNGDMRVGTVVLAYDRAHDRFSSIFRQVTGRNNNQEIRYIAEGPLRDAIIVAEPAERAPFGYWITVHRLTPAYTYRQVLRFRSATRYGDNNPLSVIDSDMPNIQRRLGLWRPGKPMPMPARGCPKPRLVRMELWCS